jgi:hypothetical protein
MKALRFFAICMIVVGFAATIVPAQTLQRPISDFLNAQSQYPGAYEIWYTARSSMPGCPGGKSGPYPAAFVDYAGHWTAYLAANGISLGTTMSGAVHQSDNGDGTSTVSVELYTMNALSYAFCFDGPGTLYLGFYAPQVAGGSPAALGSSHMSLVMNIAGTGPDAPLPNLPLINAVCPEAPPCLKSLKFTATASGLLGSPYGTQAGDPGTLSLEQIGTLHDTGRASNDGFTAEFVTVAPGP